MSYPYERRRFRRFNLNVPAMVEVLTAGTEVQTYPAKVLDISEGGMQLETREPVAVVGSEVLIQVALGERINVYAKIRQVDAIEVDLSEDEEGSESVVRWTDGSSGKFGVEFIDLEPSVRAKLKALVERLIEVNGDITKV